MYRAINEETDDNITPENDDYKMFVLVLMSHGAKNGSIFGYDGDAISLTDVRSLLCPENFPNMSGKPKIIIIQACAGGRNK